MGEHQIRWFQTMKKKYGLKTDEEVRELMRQWGVKGRKTGTGGFFYMQANNPKRLKEISRQAGKKRFNDRKTVQDLP